ncbi:MAG: Gfo/Idh/MocA family oxidoreductase [Candidatus Pacebacteria bacterium]|nr:Gfo/Idh/MocA family oxidoreductase [Candidatus Paceibacterota bacterium]
MIGAGKMGSHHCRIFSATDGVELVAVIDQNANRAARLAALHGCAAGHDPSSLAGRVDAVSIAVPSALHGAIGSMMLELGIACLIEKPLALTEADCLKLITLAEQRDLVLAVGHVERFNPAVVAAVDYLRDKEILAIETRRLNPGSARIVDNDVVSDLMVHDLDIIHHILGREPLEVYARGVAPLQPDLPDQVTAILRFAPKTLVTLLASRITQVRRRDMQIMTTEGLVVVDFLAQTAEVLRPRPSATGMAAGIVSEFLPIRVVEPLTAEFHQFIAAVRGESTEAGATGREALAALRSVWAIQESLRLAQN